MEVLSKETIEFLNNNKGKKIVFTNGCFDILHLGHVEYLNEAKAQGDVLIVAINSDASVRKIKGPDRPINNENDRMQMLLNLKAVDCVQIFTEETPVEIIKLIRPNVLVKGGDWKPEQILGSDFVLANGGEVKSLLFKKGYSTSNLIQAVQGRKQSVQIYFEASADCDYFYFFSVQGSSFIRLPDDILIGDLLSFIQSSLDQIRPVVLLSSLDFQSEINLSTLRSNHSKIESKKYIFLNYSIRNSLSKLNQKNFSVISYTQIEDFFVEKFQK